MDHVFIDEIKKNQVFQATARIPIAYKQADRNTKC